MNLETTKRRKHLQDVNVWVLRSLVEAPTTVESRQSRTNHGWASGSNQWSSRHDTWAATWGQHEWSHGQDQCSEGQHRWEGTGQSSHLLDAVDVLVVSGTNSIEDEDGSVACPQDSCPVSAAQPPSSSPCQASVADVAIQTDLSFFLAANKDTQYPEYNTPPAMPASSLCPLVSIPLKSPLLSCNPSSLQCKSRPVYREGVSQQRQELV